VFDANEDHERIFCCIMYVWTKPKREYMHDVIRQGQKKNPGLIACVGQVTFGLEQVKMEVWWFV